MKAHDYFNIYWLSQAIIFVCLIGFMKDLFTYLSILATTPVRYPMFFWYFARSNRSVKPDKSKSFNKFVESGEHLDHEYFTRYYFRKLLPTLLSELNGENNNQNID